MSAPRVLLIEDEAPQRKILGQYLKKKGYEVYEAANGEEGLDQAERTRPEIILLDWKLPDRDGLELISPLKKISPFSSIIMLTAFATVERAVTAIKLGAYYYLTKPVNLEELLLLMERALEEGRLRREVESLRQQLREMRLPEAEDLIAESPSMKEILRLAARVAPTEATVLLTGEAGTGKEVIARLIHRLSPRRDQPFVQVNCAAIPEGLLESELFGHEKGAFTGADRTKPGLFEEAQGGTLFLDEIGEMPLALQAKLLQVLQNKTFRRVGGTKEIQCQARIIAATNRDLAQMVKEGRFREDLFWRLNVFALHLPPLRERPEDIGPLAHYFLGKYAAQYQKALQGFTREALEFLLTHPFPGNVRELKNLVERAVILAEGDLIRLKDLSPVSPEPHSWVQSLLTLPLTEAVELLERKRIEEALARAQGVKTKAAQLLGISERALRYKLEKLGLSSSF